MRLIDADALMEMLTKKEAVLMLKGFSDKAMKCNYAKSVIADAPTVADIVRCKDCIEIDKHGFCPIVEDYPGKDNFCSWGERKGGTE